MNGKIIDDMKIEKKACIELTFFSFFCAIITIIHKYFSFFENLERNLSITMNALFFSSGVLGIYGWIYAIKYRVEIDNERVYLKTLFRKIEINICDIKKYSCNRYRKSVFYQFYLFTENKRVLINTRYKDEFEKILKEHDIKQVFKKKKKK